MTQVLEKAIQHARQQPPDIQNLLGQVLLDTVDDEDTWNELVRSDRSQSFLSLQAKNIREKIKQNKVSKLHIKDL